MSTSRRKETALGFLRTTGIDALLDFSSPVIIYKITAQQEDGHFYFPFADISSQSQHAEEQEVLFSPGSMFKVVKLETMIENDMVIFECEMIHEGRFKESQDGLEALLVTEKTPFIIFGKYLTDRGKFNEAIDLYIRLQSITDDPVTRFTYAFQAQAIKKRQKHIQTTGADWSLLSILPPGPFRDFVEQMPPPPSLTTATVDQDVTNYFRSGNQYSMLGKFSEFSFTYVPQLMREQQWDLAILLLQTILNTQLPTPDYIHTSSGIAYLLHINGDHLQSLYRYIEISEFVNQDPTLKDSGVDIKIQGYIEIVLSKIIDMD